AYDFGAVKEQPGGKYGYAFMMPASNVNIIAEYESASGNNESASGNNGSASGNNDSATYLVKLGNVSGDGTVHLKEKNGIGGYSVHNWAAGTEIVIVTQPANGFKVKDEPKAILTTNDGQETSLTLTYEGTHDGTSEYSFVLPANEVTVSVEFVARVKSTLVKQWGGDLSASMTIQETLEGSGEYYEGELATIDTWASNQVVTSLTLEKMSDNSTTLWHRGDPDTDDIWEYGTGVRFLMPAYNAGVNITLGYPALAFYDKTGSLLLSTKFDISARSKDIVLNASDALTQDELLALLAAGQFSCRSADTTVADIAVTNDARVFRIEAKGAGTATVSVAITVNSTTSYTAKLRVTVTDAMLSTSAKTFTKPDGKTFTMKYATTADFPGEITSVKFEYTENAQDSSKSYYGAIVNFADSPTLAEGSVFKLDYVDSSGSIIKPLYISNSDSKMLARINLEDLHEGADLTLRCSIESSGALVSKNAPIRFNDGYPSNWSDGQDISVNANSIVDSFAIKKQVINDNTILMLVPNPSESPNSALWHGKTMYLFGPDGSIITAEDPAGGNEVPLAFTYQSEMNAFPVNFAAIGGYGSIDICVIESSITLDATGANSVAVKSLEGKNFTMKFTKDEDLPIVSSATLKYKGDVSKSYYDVEIEFSESLSLSGNMLKLDFRKGNTSVGRPIYFTDSDTKYLARLNVSDILDNADITLECSVVEIGGAGANATGGAVLSVNSPMRFNSDDPSDWDKGCDFTVLEGTVVDNFTVLYREGVWVIKPAEALDNDTVQTVRMIFYKPNANGDLSMICDNDRIPITAMYNPDMRAFCAQISYFTDGYGNLVTNDIRLKVITTSWTLDTTGATAKTVTSPDGVRALFKYSPNIPGNGCPAMASVQVCLDHTLTKYNVYFTFADPVDLAADSSMLRISADNDLFDPTYFLTPVSEYMIDIPLERISDGREICLEAAKYGAAVLSTRSNESTAVRFNINREGQYATIQPVFMRLILDTENSLVSDLTINAANLESWNMTISHTPIVDSAETVVRFTYYDEQGIDNSQPYPYDTDSSTAETIYYRLNLSSLSEIGDELHVAVEAAD
ncbi:MAG: hypothetical protein K6E19_09745, partial [Lachnospiraceae bacterium]|nr:hypothetical protein [Lachnospiraceae bacterium]